MARYRLKSEEELAWNAIRRELTAKVSLEAAAWKEARLNELLPTMQVEFQKMLKKGDLPKLEADYEKWLEAALAAMQKPTLNAADRK